MRTASFPLLLVFLLHHADSLTTCSNFTTCESCAGVRVASQTCEFCLASKACGVSGTTNCAHTDRIDIDYDCPRSIPSGSSAYNDTLIRSFALPLIAASYAPTPQDCFDAQIPGAQFYQPTEVSCDDSGHGDKCYAYTAYVPSREAIVIGFRGTTGDWEMIEEILGITKPPRAFLGLGNVFQYFYDGFYYLWDGGLLANYLLLQSLHPNFKEVWVVGHSLGGSMASLCSTILSQQKLARADQIRMVTFGEPRTGDVGYARGHDALVPNSFRIVHKYDLIAHLPPKMGNDSLFHHRFEVWYENDMSEGQSYIVCGRADDDSCSNRALDIVYDDHLHYFNLPVSDWGSAGCPSHFVAPTKKSFK